MAMSSSTVCLDDLPLETLQLIATLLHHTDRPAFSAFSLANRNLHLAALPSIFRKVTLTVGHPDTLKLDVNNLLDTLSRTDSTRHVRYLSLEGFLRVGDDFIRQAESVPMTVDQMSAMTESGIEEILGGEEPVFPFSGNHNLNNGPVIERVSEEDLSWAPVVDLMKDLPGLKMLVYDCSNQFPPSLLDAIHGHPSCKLKHLTFWLRSLSQDVPDPYEMALATSPSLCSIKVRCAWRDSNGDDDFNHEAVMELAAGLAPNLKEVVVVYFVPYIRTVLQRRPRGTWRGLPGFVPNSSLGSLASLALLGSMDFGNANVVRAWSQHIDYNRLQNLELGGGYEDFFRGGLTVVAMEWLVENCSFSQLKSLRAFLNRNDNMVEQPNYSNVVASFFRAFEPLEQLLVTGGLDSNILDAILSKHGSTLQNLTLRPNEVWSFPSNGRIPEVPMVLEKKQLQQIQTQCPVLQKLSITVKRTKSDAVETELYKGLGKMESLQVLFLTLDCSDMRVSRDSTRINEPSFDDFDRQFMWETNGENVLQAGHVRETFMNCAVDEKLARSIWNTISQAKAGKPLTSLKLWTTGGDTWGNGRSVGGIRDVVDKLSRSWLIKRASEGGQSTAIDVKELGRQRRDHRKKWWDAEFNPSSDTYRHRGRGNEGWPPVRQIFHRIWAPRDNSEDWGEEWESLPLQA